MYIKNMSIKNFKSIEEAEIEFNPLTMIVGANASGTVIALCKLTFQHFRVFCAYAVKVVAFGCDLNGFFGFVALCALIDER